MPGLPARCTRCGYAFEGHAIHIGDNVEGLELEDNIENCPRCGGVARIIEGRFRIQDGVVEVLGDAVADPGLWELFRNLAAQARDGAISSEQAADRMAQQSPAVKSLLDRVPPKARKALAGVLITAINLIAGQGLAELRDNSATPADVQRIEQQHDRQTASEIHAAVERALEYYYAQHPPDQPAATSGASPTVRRAKVGRNAPCPCGSGVKYKKCCGR